MATQYAPLNEGTPQQPGNYPPPTGNPIEMTGGQMILPVCLDNFDQPTLFRCPNCSHQGVSNVKKEAGRGTWQLCCLMCFCTGCCCIPFFVDSCQDKKHFCPACQQQVGWKQYKVCN